MIQDLSYFTSLWTSEPRGVDTERSTIVDLLIKIPGPLKQAAAIFSKGPKFVKKTKKNIKISLSRWVCRPIGRCRVGWREDRQI